MNAQLLGKVLAGVAAAFVVGLLGYAIGHDDSSSDRARIASGSHAWKHADHDQARSDRGWQHRRDRAEATGERGRHSAAPGRRYATGDHVKRDRMQAFAARLGVDETELRDALRDIHADRAAGTAHGTDGIVDALAQRLGVPADEVRDAFRGGRRG